MTIVYDAHETSFAGNGIAVLTPDSCEAGEAINGDFQLEMIHHLDELGKYKEIVEDRIIRADTHRGQQLFRIYRVDRDIVGEVHVHARHISYDLLQGLIINAAPTDDTASDALQKALANTGFSGMSDVQGINSVRWVRKSNLAAIMGTEDNSIISRWGGEVERDNFTFNIRMQLGNDNGASIRYGKNLIGLNASIDISGVKTRIYPTGLQEDGQTVLSLPEEYVDSPNIGAYANIRTAHIHYGNIKIGEDYPTQEEAYAALREAVQAEFDAGLDRPSVSMDVSFVDLSQTQEYQDYAVLEKVDIGDSVYIYHEKLQVEAKARVVSARWNCLLKRYISLAIGKVRLDLSSATQAATQRIAQGISSEIEGLQTAIQQATDALNAPGNSYVRFMPNISNPAEIYIMDAATPESANNVLRLNSAGWGLSRTGINGPFTIAATGAGMVADAITTGILNANLIQMQGSGTNITGTTITVQHPSLNGYSTLGTDGLRLFVSGQLVGGLFRATQQDGTQKIVMAASTLHDPRVEGGFFADIGYVPLWDGAVGIALSLDEKRLGVIGGGGNYGGDGKFAVHSYGELWLADGLGNVITLSDIIARLPID